MATEYYLVKPRTKELYCLGKRLDFFTRINNECYNKEADYNNYDCFHDFLLDVIENNQCFMEGMWDETWGTINELLYEIWEFIEGDKILFISDISDNFSQYSSYKEVGSIYDFFEKKYKEEEIGSS